MNLLQAENLLKGSALLDQIAELRHSLNYDSDEKLESFDDHFLSLQKQVDGIKKIKLLNSIPARQGGMYENELISGLEEINDSIELLTIKLIRFQGDLLKAAGAVEDLRASFEAWYTLAAQEVLAAEKVKLPAKHIDTLASSEFNRLMGSKSQSLAAIHEAVKIELRRLEGKKKMAKQKFDMGREQVNAAWGNKLMSDNGKNANSPQFRLLADEEEPKTEEEEPEKPLTFFSGTPMFKVGAAAPVKVIGPAPIDLEEI